MNASPPRRRPPAAVLRPDLYQRYSRLEERIGHTLLPSDVALPELTGIPAGPDAGTPGLSEGLSTDSGADP